MIRLSRTLFAPAASTGSLAPEKATGWLRRPVSRQLNGWVIDQLRLQPYQHVLEIGFGTGHLLEETARALRIGFLAGMEPSVPLYQQAYRRNRRFISRQLVQLHLGELQDLPYPPHYFHTVYSTSGIPQGNDRIVELLRLTRLLRSGGRLVLLFPSGTGRKDTGLRMLAQQVQQEYIAAGLRHIHIEYREGAFGDTLAATGFTA
jgi:ubiquinone/menaquinone biosynthesis C-methylase UbiE